jgi:hypothetical protein
MSTPLYRQCYSLYLPLYLLLFTSYLFTSYASRFIWLVAGTPRQHRPWHRHSCLCSIAEPEKSAAPPLKCKNPPAPKGSEGLRNSMFCELSQLFSSFLRGASCLKSPRAATPAALLLCWNQPELSREPQVFGARTRFHTGHFPHPSDPKPLITGPICQ